MNVLLIEDDANDILFFERAWAEAGGGIPLRIALDADQARTRLQESPAPSLVVLDLLLQRGSGLDVLEWLRAQPALKEIPVVVLTSYRCPAELARAWALGIDALEEKTDSLAELAAVVKGIRARLGTDAPRGKVGREGFEPPTLCV
jgi:CheY-like chemotaxis protein